MIATPKPVKGSLRERSPGVWQVRASLGRDPATHRYRYAAATVRGTKRDAQRAAALAEELGTKDLQKLKVSDLDAF